MLKIEQHYKLFICLLTCIFSATTISLSIQWNRNELKIYRFNGTDWKGYISGWIEMEILTEPTADTMGTCRISGNNGRYIAKNLVLPKIVRNPNNNQLYVPTEIADQGFTACELKGSLTIPGHIKTLNSAAFIGVTTVDGSLIIEEGVETIDYNAFYGDTFTGTLVLPSTVTYIGQNAFNSTKNLKEIKFMNGLSGLIWNSFTNSGATSIVFDGWQSLPTWPTGQLFRYLPETGTVRSINSPISSVEFCDYLKLRSLPSGWSPI